MNDAQLQRDLGRLEGKVEALDKKIDDMSGKLDIALGQLNRARGAGIAGASVVSALVAFATAWFTK